jgi:glycosyl transferase family 4
VTDASGRLRVALVHHGRGAPVVHNLAAALEHLGVGVSVIGAAPTPLEGVLRRRGFAGPLTHVPATLRALMRDDPDVVHVFSPQDAWAAFAWRRRNRHPVVFSVIEPIERERLADGRLQLRLLNAALEQSDAVIVHDDAARATAWRWLALEPQVIAPGEGAALERLYRQLLDQT